MERTKHNKERETMLYELKLFGAAVLAVIFIPPLSVTAGEVIGNMITHFL